MESLRGAIPPWLLLALALPLGVEGRSRSTVWLGVGGFWLFSRRGLTSSVELGGAGVSGGSFMSASRFPAARAATSLRSAAEEVRETSERKELAEAWGSAWGPARPRSLTFLDSAASVELADCGLNGEPKASKRAAAAASSERPPVAGMEEDEEDEEEEDDDEDEEEEQAEEAATAPLSCSTALAAAFSFWMAESGERLLLGTEQPDGGHTSAPGGHTKPPAPPPSQGSCLMPAGGAEEAGEPAVDPLLLLPPPQASFRASALSCWA